MPQPSQLRVAAACVLVAIVWAALALGWTRIFALAWLAYPALVALRLSRARRLREAEEQAPPPGPGSLN